MVGDLTRRQDVPTQQPVQDFPCKVPLRAVVGEADTEGVADNIKEWTAKEHVTTVISIQKTTRVLYCASLFPSPLDYFDSHGLIESIRIRRMPMAGHNIQQ